MRVVYVNGSRSDLTWHEMRKLFLHRYFVGIVLAASAIVVALRPYDDMVDLNVVRLTIFYANSVACFVAVLVGSVYASQRAGRTVYAFAAIAFAVIVATVYGITSATLLGAQIPPLIDIVMVTVFNLVFGLVGELIFASFLLPVILREIGAPALQSTLDIRDQDSQTFERSEPKAPRPEPSPQRPVIVSILGSDFLVAEIVMISADAHYVQIVQKAGMTKMLRGRISDAVASMPEDRGKMVHRSYWIAASAVVRIEPEGRNHQLVLSDGKRVPIARSRLQEIKAWVAELGKEKRAPSADALK